MKEIRWHGRGGQGAVVAARVLAIAMDKEGKSIMAFPKFGAERRGAPVMAFTGFDDKPIREKTQLYHPDCLVVIDSTLIHSVKNIFEGTKAGAILVVNAAEPVTEPYHHNLVTIGTVDATTIGLVEIGRPITNTPMLGAFARTTGWVQLNSILSGLEEYFTGTVLEKNIRCVQRAYEETKIAKF